MRRGLAAGALLAAVLLARGARAQTRCPVPSGASAALEDVDAEARLAFLRSVMRDQASRAKTWTWAWSGIGFGLAAGQYALIPLVHSDKRFEQAFEGTASLFIPAAIAVQPLRVRADDETLERFLADTEAPRGAMEPCLRLERAEELAALSAADESMHTAWYQHVVSIALSVGYGAIIGVGFKDVGGMFFNGGSAIAIGEAQLLTAPTGAARALERYQRGDLGAPAARASLSFRLTPLGVAPGLALAVRF